MINISNKKGVILLMAILFGIIIAIIAASTLSAFSYFAQFTKKHQEDLHTEYTADCGIFYGKWLIDTLEEPEGTDIEGTKIFDSHDFGNSFDVDGEDVHVVINWDSTSKYTIRSTLNQKTTIVEYDNQKIVSWS